MDAKTFQVLYDDAVKAIMSEQLSDALSALKGLAVNLQFPADSWQAMMIPDALQQLTENNISRQDSEICTNVVCLLSTDVSFLPVW